MFGRRRKIPGRDILGLGARVHIFAPTKDDADDFIAFTLGNRNFHQPWVHPATDMASYRNYLDRVDGVRAQGFLIRSNADEDLVGVININDMILGGFCSASLGYYGAEAYARRGYMAEGLSLVLDQAFGPLGLHRIESNVQPANAASLALIARLGFRKEGFSPAFLHIDGAWRDHERWAMLAEDWRRPTAEPLSHLSRVV